MGNKTNRCGGVMKDFDIKSKKSKNKKNYSKANDYNADKYDQSATQSNFNFKKNSLEEFADNPHNRAAQKDNPMFDKKGPSVLYKKYCGKGNPDKVFKQTTPGHFTKPERVEA